MAVPLFRMSIAHAFYYLNITNMRKKIIYYGIVWLSLHSCSDASANAKDDGTMGFILVFIAILIGVLIYGIKEEIKHQTEQAEKNAAKEAKRKVLREEREIARKKAFQEDRAAMIEQYGDITKEIPLYKYSDDIEDMFIVFEGSSTL
ncbi:MAG: hypothetical protein IIW11_02875, partial [Bacteroidales bacterium]|nr:hypothetical protein [Bacteroidales bacterium]